MIEYLYKIIKCKTWSANTKPLFWENEASVETSQKLLSQIGVTHKHILEFVKSLNKFIWVIVYLYKAVKCQIWSKNTKRYFWGNEALVETFQIFSYHIGVTYKYAEESLKGLNWLVWVFKHCRNVWKYKIFSTNTKLFFWKSETNF